MTDNPFSKLYSTIDSSELLDIMDFPNDFQPLAVEAARLEIERRQLTPEELEEAKTKQEIRLQKKMKGQQAVKNIEDKMNSMIDTYSPIQTGGLTTEKQINLIVFFLVGLFLYRLYVEFGLLLFMITDSQAEWDISTLLYLTPFFLLPTAGTLFGLRKKLGWMLTMIFASYTAAGTIPLLITELSREPSAESVLDIIFPTTSPVAYIVGFLIYGGLAWTLCKGEIRSVFHIDKQQMFLAICIGIGLIVLTAFVF